MTIIVASNSGPGVHSIEDWLDRLELILEADLSAFQSGFFDLPAREETYVGLLASALPNDAIWLIETRVRKKDSKSGELTDGRRDLWVSTNDGDKRPTFSIEAKHLPLQLDQSVTVSKETLLRELRVATDDARRVPSHARTVHNYGISFTPLFWDGYRTTNGDSEKSAVANLAEAAEATEGRNRFHRIYLAPSEMWSRVDSSTWPGLLVIGQKIDRD